MSSSPQSSPAWFDDDWRSSGRPVELLVSNIGQLCTMIDPEAAGDGPRRGEHAADLGCVEQAALAVAGLPAAGGETQVLENGEVRLAFALEDGLLYLGEGTDKTTGLQFIEPEVPAARRRNLWQVQTNFVSTLWARTKISTRWVCSGMSAWIRSRH